jgi:hypothetical protein
MQLSCAALTCAMCLRLAAKESSSSSAESSGQLMISHSRISKTCVQVLTVSVAHGVVSNRMSAFRFESSPVASGFFSIFHGAIISKETE